MVWRDLVSYQELEQFLSATHDLLVCYLETCASDVIEGYLNDNNEEFLEFIHNDLGREIEDYERFNKC